MYVVDFYNVTVETMLVNVECGHQRFCEVNGDV